LDRLDDDAVFIPECESEAMISDCFNMSIQRSFDGPVIDYEIVRDYVKRTDDDPVEVYRVLRVMLSKLNG